MVTNHAATESDRQLPQAAVLDPPVPRKAWSEPRIERRASVRRVTLFSGGTVGGAIAP